MNEFGIFGGFGESAKPSFPSPQPSPAENLTVATTERISTKHEVLYIHYFSEMGKRSSHFTA